MLKFINLKNTVPFRIKLAVWTAVLPIVILYSLSAAIADQKRTINMACNEFPPQKIEASPDGLLGIDVEILRAAFSKSNIAVDVTYFPWKRALELAKAGEVDGLCSCSYLKERTKWFLYTDVMGTIGEGIFHKPTASTPVFRSLEDLQDLTIGVVRGYNLGKKLKDIDLQLVEVSADEKGIKMLLSGRIQAFYSFKGPGEYVLSKTPNSNHIKFDEVHNSPYYACFNNSLPNATEWVSKFNTGLNSIKADGTYDLILNKYR